MFVTIDKFLAFNGSTPGKRMKNIGVIELVPSKDLWKGGDLDSTNFESSFPSTKHLNKFTKYNILNNLRKKEIF